MTHNKWTRIKLFHNLIKWIESKKEYIESINEKFIYPNIDYMAKIKLDGTNAGVQIFPDKRVIAQGHYRILSVDDDNQGFCAWVQCNEKYFSRIMKGDLYTYSKCFNLPITIFGEWCGCGIQKRTAISKIGRKIFAVFAVQYNNRIVVCPQMIQTLIPYHGDIFVLPWLNDMISIDFGDKVCIESAVEEINTRISEIEKRDPWVHSCFEIDGIGEGIVLYPIYDCHESEYANIKNCTDLMFKAKGKKHSVIKQSNPVQINPEVAKSINEFVDLFVTQNRLEQVTEFLVCSEMKYIGPFLKWVNTDIKEESVDELEASGLEWKQVTKHITRRAKEWYISRIENENRRKDMI